MTTTLRPLPPEAFAAYMQASIASYAQENVQASRWPAEGALERSHADFLALLPQGLATPDHHLFEVLAAPEGPVVGHLWLALECRHGDCGAFVYNVEIAPEHRRQGHARRAFQAMEAVAAELGATSIGLHVFATNPGAQALYESLGYRVTGVNMKKGLLTAPSGA